MASGDVFERLRPIDFSSEQGGIIGGNNLKGVGKVHALPMGRDGAAFLALGHVWANGTPLSTGLTVELVVVDDPDNPGAGLVAEFGVTVVPLLTTAGVLTDPATTQEVTGAATVNATEGVVTVISVALANSKLASLAAGNNFVLKVRRISSGASDTHPGRVFVVGVTVKDT